MLPAAPTVLIDENALLAEVLLSLAAYEKASQIRYIEWADASDFLGFLAWGVRARYQECDDPEGARETVDGAFLILRDALAELDGLRNSKLDREIAAEHRRDLLKDRE